MTKLPEWRKEFNKYVYQESDGKAVWTKIRHEDVEKDLFSGDIPETDARYLVRLMVWYGVTNVDLIGEVLEIISMVSAKAPTKQAKKVKEIKPIKKFLVVGDSDGRVLYPDFRDVVERVNELVEANNAVNHLLQNK